jgi:hypothetical protein
LDSSISQSSRVNQETGQKYKQSISLLTGLYGDGEDYIKINSALDLYDQPLRLTDFPSIQTPGANYGSYPVNFLEIGNETRFDCLKEQNPKSKYTSFVCEYWAIYEKTTFHLYIVGPSAMSQSEVESIVNPILPFIDACILDL